MTKAEFLALMRFPTEWETLGMYPDDLFSWQRAGYVPGHEQGAEHDRNGAFHWWLRRQPSKHQLTNLVRLAALDPDPMLANDLRQYIYRSKSFDHEVEALDRSLFSAPPP
jgi:hypothetical protein